MIFKKSVPTFTVIVFLALFLSNSPVLAQKLTDFAPNASLAGRHLQVQTNFLQAAAAQLQNNITAAITNLTKSDTNLKTKLSQIPAGTDVSAAQTAVTNLESQITTLQGLSVPADPTALSDLTIIRQTFRTTRLAAQKDIVTANQALRTALQTANRIANLIAQSDKAIDARITSLNTRITRINALKNLSDSQKTAFASQFQTRITDLTSLKAKIDADTDLPTLKADYQSIFTDYRIFAIFEPEMNIMAQADSIIARANTLLAKTTNTDAQAKLNDAITQANAAINEVSVLTPADYPATAVLTAARGSLKLARTDIAAAYPLMSK